MSSYISETAWSASNGGFSQYFLRPWYQNGVQSNTYRGVPDVAANANPDTGYEICFANSCQLIGGKKDKFNKIVLPCNDMDFFGICPRSKNKIFGSSYGTHC